VTTESIRRADGRAEIEGLVLGVWRGLLGVPGLTREDDFFGAGGDSLLAVEAVLQVQEAAQVNIPIATLFLWPTPSEFAQAVADLRSANGMSNPS
jgi:acyl carrier protein